MFIFVANVGPNMNKKLFFLLLFLSTANLISCNKNNPDKDTDNGDTSLWVALYDGEYSSTEFKDDKCYIYRDGNLQYTCPSSSVVVRKGTEFRLQDEISRDLIIRMLGTKYGANKSVQNVQINVTAQMLECELIKRDKMGVYAYAEPQKPMHKVTYELWRESYFVNEPLANREDTDSVLFEPYFRYLKIV